MHRTGSGRFAHFLKMILLGAAAWSGTEFRSATAATATSHPPPEPQVAGFEMIELRVIACRAENCREVSLLYDAFEMSLMTCMIAGQQEAARWQSSNPAWEIRRWSCRFLGSGEGRA